MNQPLSALALLLAELQEERLALRADNDALTARLRAEQEADGPIVVDEPEPDV